MAVLTHLLDTDVAIELLCNRDQAVARQAARHRDIGLSTVSVMELAFGAARSLDDRAQMKVEALIATVTVLDFDAAAAREAGNVRAELAQAGTQIGPYDRLIAGHARSRNLILVTRNVREFERVGGLRLEYW